MSMYNLVHGVNPFAGILLQALGITHAQVPRFRDCWWTGEHIVLYTRTGGGNREAYEKGGAYAEDHQGPWNDDLRLIEGYVRDEDDSYDTTYAAFYYTPSPTLADALKALPVADATPEQRWKAFMEKLKAGQRDDQTKRVLDELQPMFDQIQGLVDPTKKG